MNKWKWFCPWFTLVLAVAILFLWGLRCGQRLWSRFYWFARRLCCDRRVNLGTLLIHMGGK